MKVLHRHLLNQRVLKFSLVVFVRIEKYFLTNKVAALLGRFWRPRNCQDNAFLINDHSRHWFNGIILRFLLGILDRLFDGDAASQVVYCDASNITDITLKKRWGATDMTTIHMRRLGFEVQKVDVFGFT